MQPYSNPVTQPSAQPSHRPKRSPTKQPIKTPSKQPTSLPSSPSGQPTSGPTLKPAHPSSQPSVRPSSQITCSPSFQPTKQPRYNPSLQPKSYPSKMPALTPSSQPSLTPTHQITTPPTSLAQLLQYSLVNQTYIFGVLSTLEKVSSPTLSGPSLTAFKEAIIESINIQNSLVLVGVQMQVLSFSIIGSTGTNSLRRRRRLAIGNPIADSKDLQSMSVFYYSFSVVWQFIVPLRTTSSVAMSRLYFATSSEALATLSQLLVIAANNGTTSDILSYLNPITYGNVSVSHIFSSWAPSMVPTYSPTKISAASFFLSLNHLLSTNILIASLCAGLLCIACSISLCYCVTYRQNTRKIRENKQYVQDKVSALRAVADSLSNQKSFLPSDDPFKRKTNQMNSPSDLELATGIIPSGSGEKKGRRGSHAVSPDDLQGLCAQIKALHVENNALRAQMTLVPRRLNSKIESYLATAAAAPSSSNQRETLGAKEMKRLKTYFYLLERERKRLLALKKSAASKRPGGNDQNVGAPRSLYSVVPLTTSGDISDFPFSP